MAMSHQSWLNQMGIPCSTANVGLAERARDAGAYLRRRAYRIWYRSNRTKKDDERWQRANSAAYAAEDQWFLRLIERQQEQTA